jgi:hypothetical protein
VGVVVGEEGIDGVPILAADDDDGGFVEALGGGIAEVDAVGVVAQIPGEGPGDIAVEGDLDALVAVGRMDSSSSWVRTTLLVAGAPWA